MKIAFLSMDPKGAPIRGAGYVAASIPPEHEVVFHCMMNPAKDTKYAMLPKLIAKENYDIVMVSTTTTLYLDAANIIKSIKKVKNIPVLMGGVHPTVVGSKLLEENPNIDYLCIGEGETFIKDFLNNYGKESLFEVNNLAYIREGKAHSNSLNPAEDLSKLPPFPWHLFHRVVNPNGTLNVTATRGCPYICTYCCNSIYLKMYGKSYLRTVSFNMIGWPFPNDDKLTKTTADLNKEIGPAFVQVTWFYPFPGTKLYDYCVEHDLINRSKSITSYHKGSIIKGYENKKSFFKSRGK